MYEQLKNRIAELLSRPQPIKPQTERQLSRHLTERSTDTETFLLDAAQRLEEYELDILFAPQFTPEMEDQAAVSDLLYHWRPDADELNRLTPELCACVKYSTLQLAGDVEAKLTIHEVMVERFVRLLHLDRAPPADVSATIRDALPPGLWQHATALLRQRGFTPTRQAWFARLVSHMAARHRVTEDQLAAAAHFVSGQPVLDRDTLVEAAGALVKAALGSVAYAQGGRAYWSPDVAQHHHYHGQGQVDQDLVQGRQEDVERLKVIESDLLAFEDWDGE